MSEEPKPESLEKLYGLAGRCVSAIASVKNFAFSLLCALANDAGFKERRRTSSKSGTSHVIYKHDEYVYKNSDIMNFQNENGKSKPYQVRQLVDFIQNAVPKSKKGAGK